ncbi:hypothetical protein H2200_005470 [Cladophialophora chaetospira]|uniref:Cytochrome b561 domain-containing protein n=1 Tax=Cladophialophora chaetospira TaxID=386627 RepID=A0AA39CJX8_9EURO|nr:hypothetical protein H2200_005470 [Cladophialophora chaetospira]
MAARRVLNALLLLSSIQATPTVPVPGASSSWLTTTKPSATPESTNSMQSWDALTGHLPYSFADARVAHALLGALAFLFIFPFGGIIIKVWRHRHIVWIHAAIQVFGLVVYIICGVLGVLMGYRVHTLGRYHAVTGYVVLTCLVIQPLLKLHWFHSSIPRVAFFMHIHLWLGRFALMLGIIDGALGFRVSDSLPGPHWSQSWRIVYGIIGGIVWIVYVGVCIVWIELKKVPRAAPISPGAPPEDFIAMASQLGRTESEETLKTAAVETVVIASSVETDIENGVDFPTKPRRPSRTFWNRH